MRRYKSMNEKEITKDQKDQPEDQNQMKVIEVDI